MTMLYLWANPVGWAPSLTHTMVTTYDPIVSCDPPAGDYYWYCWGTCHTAGASPDLKLFASADGDVGQATCVTTPNDSSSTEDAHGGIPSFYGRFGVCHQVANRTLIATAAGGGPALQVKGVSGSGLSYWLYGAYATEGTYEGVPMSENWEARQKQCGVMTDMADDNEIRSQSLREVLGDDEEVAALFDDVFAGVRAEKDALAEQVLAGDITREEFANSVNQLLQTVVGSLAERIGPDAAAALFDVPAEGGFALLDPAIARAEDQEAGEATETS